jgi:hypothetical protein
MRAVSAARLKWILALGAILLVVGGFSWKHLSDGSNVVFEDSPYSGMLPECSQANEFALLPDSYFLPKNATAADLSALEKRKRDTRYKEWNKGYRLADPPVSTNQPGFTSVTGRSCQDSDQFRLWMDLTEYRDPAAAMAALTASRRLSEKVVPTFEAEVEDFVMTGADDGYRVNMRSTPACEGARADEGAWACAVSDTIKQRIGRLVLSIEADAKGDFYGSPLFEIVGDRRSGANEALAAKILSLVRNLPGQ